MSLPWLGRGFPALAGFLAIFPVQAQTINNQSLNGKYFFRQVSLDGGGNPALAVSQLGAITFDGAGNYSITAQQVLGNGPASPKTASGLYSVDQAGFITMDNPVHPADKLNARYGPVAIVGSATETSGSTLDLFIAIPAPPLTQVTSVTSLSGFYWVATLEFPGGSFASARNTIFKLNSSGQGKFADFSVNGHAANVSSGQPSILQVTGPAYTMAADGTGSVSFGTASATALLSGSRTVYLSKDGNLLLGGSTSNGAHDILIGVKAISGASISTWSGNFWGAGLRRDSTAVTGYVGSIAPRGTGKFIWTRRLKASGVGNLDFTGVNGYALNPDGSGNAELGQVALGAGGTAFIGSSVNASDAGAYELYFGAQMPALSGSGTWINPQGIVNAAGFAPTGNPIAPGAFLSIYGAGLAKSAQTATPPYPLSLNGVTVLINGQSAPLYTVSDGRIDLLVPYGTQGPTASIVVQNTGTMSNTVTVPVAATAPGVLTLSQNGSGPATMQHADYSAVTAAHPAVGGETIIVYITGLGAVSPPVQDGFPGGANPVNNTVVKPAVLVGGVPGTVAFSGLSNFPGLYQINVQLPPIPPGVTTLPMAVQTPNAYHDQVDIPVQP